MDFTEYQTLAKRTLSDAARENLLLDGAMGLCGEAGEVIDLMKKHMFLGHSLDKAALIDEASDCMWYLAELATGLGISLEDIAAHNIEKLKKRYPAGFSVQKSINRAGGKPHTAQTALLVVDVQNALVADEPYNIETVLENIGRLAGACREKNIPVLYVQHDGGKGDALEKGTAGWQIHSAVAPVQSEKTFDKACNSAFKNTKLHAYLSENGITDLILTGMQTEYCIDATCKSAFDLDYSIRIPENCITTYDNASMSAENTNVFYHDIIWKNRFAAVQPLCALLQSFDV